MPFWTIPGTDRELLCDLWRPADGGNSGLAFIYFHGSGWFLSDKDFGTRPFFRHLVAQGHTVMDVAYRLIPEVDIYGMVGDAKRAVAWMKANAEHYGVNPEKIVLGGGSAGGHIALLAGYTPEHPELTPDELEQMFDMFSDPSRTVSVAPGEAKATTGLATCKVRLAAAVRGTSSCSARSSPITNRCRHWKLARTCPCTC